MSNTQKRVAKIAQLCTKVKSYFDWSGEHHVARLEGNLLVASEGEARTWVAMTLNARVETDAHDARPPVRQAEMLALQSLSGRRRRCSGADRGGWAWIDDRALVASLIDGTDAEEVVVFGHRLECVAQLRYRTSIRQEYGCTRRGGTRPKRFRRLAPDGFVVTGPGRVRMPSWTLRNYTNRTSY